MKRTELADQLHDKKYNCCQAVLCAWADKTGVDTQTLFRIACEIAGEVLYPEDSGEI